MKDNDKPINYAILSGSYKGMIQGLAYTLTSKKFVDYDKYDELKNFLMSEIYRIERFERENG
jgi:hypothetical protein